MLDGGYEGREGLRAEYVDVLEGCLYRGTLVGVLCRFSHVQSELLHQSHDVKGAVQVEDNNAGFTSVELSGQNVRRDQSVK